MSTHVRSPSLSPSPRKVCEIRYLCSSCRFSGRRDGALGSEAGTGAYMVSLERDFWLALCRAYGGVKSWKR